MRFPPATHLIVLAPSRERAEAARDLAASTLATLGLRLHPDKTRIAGLRHGAEGFDFLGFHHRMVESWKRRRPYYLNKWPAHRAMASIRAKVRERTRRGYAGLDMAVVVDNLNPVLRGWGAYFRYGNPSRKFNAIDGYVHERLAKLASVKHGLPGRNWTTRFTYGWLTQLGIYRLTGTVRYWSANARRRTLSESRVRENRMHGSIGAAGQTVVHGEAEHAPDGETRGTEPARSTAHRAATGPSAVRGDLLPDGLAPGRTNGYGWPRAGRCLYGHRRSEPCVLIVSSSTDELMTVGDGSQ